MRWRVGAQGFTVFALIAGVGYQSMSKKDATKTDWNIRVTVTGVDYNIRARLISCFTLCHIIL